MRRTAGGGNTRERGNAGTRERGNFQLIIASRVGSGPVFGQAVPAAQFSPNPPQLIGIVLKTANNHSKVTSPLVSLVRTYWYMIYYSSIYTNTGSRHQTKGEERCRDPTAQRTVPVVFTELLRETAPSTHKPTTIPPISILLFNATPSSSVEPVSIPVTP